MEGIDIGTGTRLPVGLTHMWVEQQVMAAARPPPQILVYILVHKSVGVGELAFAVVMLVKFGDADAAAHRYCRAAEIDETFVEHHFDLLGPGGASLAAAFGKKDR